MMSFLYRQTARLEITVMSIAATMMAIAIPPAGCPRLPSTADAGCNSARAIIKAVASARDFIVIFLTRRELE